jgi:predicted MFS family arabinose efflux permease
VRPGAAASTGILALLVLVACTRTIAGSALALQLAGDRRLAAMGVRAATGQFGYLFGAAVGGAALAAGGYEMVGVALAALFVLGTIPHLTAIVSESRARRGRDSSVFAPWSADPDAAGVAP